MSTPAPTGSTDDRRIPMINTGPATTIPASGPLKPRSKRAFLVGIGDFTFITAPNVPMRVGAGTKYGNVASTPCFLAATKWAVSCIYITNL